MRRQRWHVVHDTEHNALIIVPPATPGAFEVEQLVAPIAGPDTEQPADALQLRPLDPP